MTIYDALINDPSMSLDDKIEMFSKRIMELSIAMENSFCKPGVKLLMENTIELNIQFLKRATTARDLRQRGQLYVPRMQ